MDTSAHFCPRCGRSLAPRLYEGRERAVCSSCGYVHYVNPIVAAGTLTTRGDSVLLIKRGVEPGLGLWGLPAGYAEAGEDPQETAIRETLEETGIRPELTGLVGVFGFRQERQPGGVLILYAGSAETGTPNPGDDATEARFIRAAELPADDNVAFGLHRHVLQHWGQSWLIRCDLMTAEQRPAALTLCRDAGFSAKHVEDAPDRIVWVAYDRDAVLGLLACHVEHDHLCTKVIYVHPTYRRWGLARRLLTILRNEANNRNACIKTLAPITGEAVGLLVSEGYRAVAIQHSGAGDQLLMRLDDTVQR